MQIYFIASSRLVEKDKNLYSQMYKTIAEDNKMVSDKVWKWTKLGIQDLSQAPLQAKKENYEQILKSIHKADMVIMEISGHSMTMGYVISKALEENKPVIALYKSEASPIFVRGIFDQKLILAEYNKENLDKVIFESIKKAKSLVDMRFNFFVSPRILNYLDWIGQKRMIPKSVFLRNLIEREMKKDREFKG
jgi:hypothetical protein